MPSPAAPTRRATRAVLTLLALGAATCLAAAVLYAQPGAAPDRQAAERCEPAGGGGATPVALVGRALDAAGAGALAGGRVHARYADAVSHRYESDRMYGPALTYVHTGELWSDPASGAQRTDEQMLGAGGAFAMPAMVVTSHGSFAARGDSLTPVPAMHAFPGTQRRAAMDPLGVLAAWREAAAAGAVRVAGRCLYRDRWRTVLARAAGPDALAVGDERLYLDPGSGLPVKLDRRERDALWGAVHAEYVYTNWELVRGAAGVRYPIAVARLADGEVDMARSLGAMDVVAAGPGTVRTSAPSSDPMPTWREVSDAPDTLRVGAHAFLLAARGYSSLVALARDTVFVVDATVGEARARLDSGWVARLFPGRHPVRLVVTDLAWPHVSGVRFWVARGATVVSHRDSRAFLERVVARRWSDTPDALERLRAADPQAARLRFVAVGDSLSLAGGLLRLLAIDGLGSEGALSAYFPSDRFLWAGDYVQNVRGPTTYAAEVIAAMARHGVAPERIAAMHLAVTPWSTVVAAQAPRTAAAGGAP